MAPKQEPMFHLVVSLTKGSLFNAGDQIVFNLQVYATKKLCIYSYILKLQSPSKSSPFDAMHLLRHFFFTAQNSFWTHWFWWLLVLLLFVSLLPRQNVSIWGLFACVETKKVIQDKIGWMRRVGHRGPAILGQKLLNTQRAVGQCTRKSPIINWADVLKESSIKFTETTGNLSQYQLVHCYRWVPRTVT